jgi:excisionase family DNA binding protein
VATIAETAPLLMSVRKAALLAGISKTTLYRWIEEGRLRSKLVGAYMRIHRDDLFAAIDALPCVGD